MTLQNQYRSPQREGFNRSPEDPKAIGALSPVDRAVGPAPRPLRSDLA